MKSNIWKFYGSILISILLHNSLTACSCSPGARLVEQEVKRSTVVLTGKVMAMELFTLEMKEGDAVIYLSLKKVELKVLKWFKGKVKEQKIVLYTGQGKGDCGVHFRIGEKYVIYRNANQGLNKV